MVTKSCARDPDGLFEALCCGLTWSSRYHHMLLSSPDCDGGDRGGGLFCCYWTRQTPNPAHVPLSRLCGVLLQTRSTWWELWGNFIFFFFFFFCIAFFSPSPNWISFTRSLLYFFYFLFHHLAPFHVPVLGLTLVLYLTHTHPSLPL